MRSVFPAAALMVLTFCSPGNDRRVGETETAGDGSGGRSSRDTMQAPAPPARANADPATIASGIFSQMNLTNTAEIQLARIASKRASSSDVKKLAEKLAVDHSKNREQGRSLAQKLKAPVTPVAGEDITVAGSAAMPSDLQAKSGASFDKAYVEHEIRGHESNIQKIQSQMLPAARDPQVKAYLQRTLADMEGHLASLKEVQRKISS